MKYNLTINATTKIITVDVLAADNTTVTGTIYIAGANVLRISDEKDGWWFDHVTEAEHNKKLMFADIVKLNGSAIGATTQADVTALLIAVLDAS